MKKISLLFILLVSVFASCDVIRTVSIMKSGSVQQKEFTTTIPFEYRRGLIVMKVGISGGVYDFILDTGAPNAISKELAEKLGLSNKAERSVKDSQNQKGDLGFTKIENVEIGGLNFLNTGAVIIDLNVSDVIRCLNVDGLLGSNLMRNAIWKFDYQAQTITITSSMESLNLSGELMKIPFTTNLQGTPNIKVKLDSITEQSAIIDLGSNGNFNLQTSSAKGIMKNNSSIGQVKYYGSRASGLYGLGAADTILYVKVPNISLGDVHVPESIATFNDTKSTVGTEFFRSYDLVINWFKNEALLIKRKDYDNSTLSTFGFSYKYEDRKIKVSGLFEGSSAFKEGLKLNDHIVEIGARKFADVTPDEWCEIMNSELYKDDDQEVVVKVLRENAVVTFTLKREKIL